MSSIQYIFNDSCEGVKNKQDINVSFDSEDYVEKGECESCGHTITLNETRTYRLNIGGKDGIDSETLTKSIPMINDITKYTPFCEHSFVVTTTSRDEEYEEEYERTTIGRVNIIELENKIFVMKIDFDDSPSSKYHIKLEIYGKSLDHFEMLVENIIYEYDNQSNLTNDHPYMINNICLNDAIIKAKKNIK